MHIILVKKLNDEATWETKAYTRRYQHGPSALQVVEWIKIIQDKVLTLVLVTMQSMVKTVFYCSDPRNVVSKLSQVQTEVFHLRMPKR